MAAGLRKSLVHAMHPSLLSLISLTILIYDMKSDGERIQFNMCNPCNHFFFYEGKS